MPNGCYIFSGIVYWPHYARAIAIVKSVKKYPLLNPRGGKLTTVQVLRSKEKHEEADFVERATGCHANHFEASGMLALALLACMSADVPRAYMNAAVLGFVVLRAVYTALYLAGAGLPRSLTWLASMLVLVHMLLTAAWP